jgi:hypothetical protein
MAFCQRVPHNSLQASYNHFHDELKSDADKAIHCLVIITSWQVALKISVISDKGNHVPQVREANKNFVTGGTQRVLIVPTVTAGVFEICHTTKVMPSLPNLRMPFELV